MTADRPMTTDRARLVQALRETADATVESPAPHMTGDMKFYVYEPDMRHLLDEAAAAIEGAGVEGYIAQHHRDSATLRETCAERDRLRAEVSRLREYEKAAGMFAIEKAEQRQRAERLEEESQTRLEACGDAVSKLCEAEARAERLAEALRWYAEQAESCRKLGRDGDSARQALDADGGKRARAALSTKAALAASSADGE